MKEINILPQKFTNLNLTRYLMSSFKIALFRGFIRETVD